MRVEERRFVGVLREMKEGTEKEGSGTLHEEEKKTGRKRGTMKRRDRVTLLIKRASRQP